MLSQRNSTMLECMNMQYSVFFGYCFLLVNSTRSLANQTFLVFLYIVFFGNFDKIVCFMYHPSPERILDLLLEPTNTSRSERQLNRKDSYLLLVMKKTEKHTQVAVVCFNLYCSFIEQFSILLFILCIYLADDCSGNYDCR